MYMHHALPKDIHIPSRQRYQIKNKRSSPNTKQNSPKVQQQLNDLSFTKGTSSQKNRIHNILSKQKPYLYSKGVSPNKPSILIKRSSISRDKTKIISQAQTNVNICSKYNTNINKFQQNQIVICKMENKVVQIKQSSFPYHDLSLIQPSYIKTYDGQSKHNGIRHGFGIQHYTNGQKFIGFFEENFANGQGTYYSIEKTIIGIWQNNKLKQIIVEI